jgi:hypothetical protein
MLKNKKQWEHDRMITLGAQPNFQCQTIIISDQQAITFGDLRSSIKPELSITRRFAESSAGSTQDGKIPS